MKDVWKVIDKKHEEMTEIALQFIESEVAKIFTKMPNICKFYMGMGTFFFTDKKGDLICHESSSRKAEFYRGQLYTYSYKKWATRLARFIDEYDRVLGLTGCTLTLTRDKNYTYGEPKI